MPADLPALTQELEMLLIEALTSTTRVGKFCPPASFARLKPWF